MPSDVMAMLGVERLWRFDKEDLWSPDSLLDFLPSEMHFRRSVVFDHPTHGVIGHAQFNVCQGRIVLSNLAVHPSFTRRGIGRRLVEVVGNLPFAALRRPQLSCVVREGNLSTQLFCKAVDFRWQHTYHTWFDCPPEDGYLLTRIIL